ncbi:MAG: helix-turn-helix domain-containing protein [Oscillospiraceae bacterium]|nr:helix-turn-helix domain-containing protein [Oscillospiraceae bacterium]
MLKENLVMLRKLNGYSQEEIAERIGISRQAYAKWESGATIPDVEKCRLLAEVYGTTVDGLLKTETVESVGVVPPAPRGKSVWGSVTVNDRGQIVIPKGARDKYGLTGGQRLIVGGDEVGIALIPADVFEEKMKQAMDLIYRQSSEE